MARIEGSTQGLKPSQIKSLNRIGQRRYPLQGGYTLEQARELAALSRSLSRQIGLLIDRQGRVELILLGDAKSVCIPTLARGRTGADKLRGLRLFHTHLGIDALSQEDLMDLLFLRLDAMSALSVDQWGSPVQFFHAHLLPTTAGTPYYVAPPMPWDACTLDLKAEIEALEDELARVLPDSKDAGDVTRALLVSVSSSSRAEQEQNLVELAELARTAGLAVTGTLIQRVASINPKSILGKGKVAELEVLALQGNASLIVFDGELSPAQLHNFADITERKVMDRTQLILDIFAQHATSRAGKLQVEMAQLKYTLPRLTGKNRAMDRLMGGIGGRGPGETKLETDRRRSRERLARIKKELDDLRRQRSFTRSRRNRQGVPVAALVGYTNAGKSSLLNALTRSDVLTEDKLFATLDPTTRRMRVPNERELVLADTVGFIRDLPKDLIEAFRATLEELDAADLLVHVADASHPDLERQLSAVENVLVQMDRAHMPRILVLNKCDMLDAERATILQQVHPEALLISAATGEGLPALSAEVARRIDWETLPDTVLLSSDEVMYMQ